MKSIVVYFIWGLLLLRYIKLITFINIGTPRHDCDFPETKLNRNSIFTSTDMRTNFFPQFLIIFTANSCTEEKHNSVLTRKRFSREIIWMPNVKKKKKHFTHSYTISKRVKKVQSHWNFCLLKQMNVNIILWFTLQGLFCLLFLKVYFVWAFNNYQSHLFVQLHQYRKDFNTMMKK